LLGTYAGQTPEELADGTAAMLLRLHISDVQGWAVEPWRFPHPAEIVGKNVYLHVKYTHTNVLLTLYP
jgi:hypothetical protein